MYKLRPSAALTSALVGILSFATSGRTANAQLYTSQVLYTAAPGTSLTTVTADGSGGGVTTASGHSYFTTWSPAGTATVYTAPSGPSIDSASTFGPILSGNLIGGEATVNGAAAHAVVLNTTLNTVTDLHPANAVTSFVIGVGNGQEVGRAREPVTSQGQTADFYRALLWTGTAASAVDLTPSAVPGSIIRIQASADATDGTHQVGAANEFAAYWSGTAASYQELQSVGDGNNEEANAVSGDQVVGYEEITGMPGTFHALYWNGVAAAPVDLTPNGLSYSRALGIGPTQQVGFVVVTGTNGDAAVWSGTAGSFIDLQQFLTSGYVNSEAQAIDANGNIFGLATDPSGNTAVIEWTPVPEPTLLLPLAAAVPLLMSRRRRTR